ncbi:MAG: Cu+-exporting ATPase, partial [Cellvibrionaceae bacterium]
SEAERLAPYFDQMLFKQTPSDKLRLIEQKREAGESVLMIGDGLNDAGALQASTVGISLSDDIYQFTPASDAILDADQLQKVDQYLRYSRKAVRIVWIAFTISLLYNIVGLSFAFAGKLTPLVSSILMPISSVTVVGFITLAVHYYAKRLFK